MQVKFRRTSPSFIFSLGTSFQAKKLSITSPVPVLIPESSSVVAMVSRFGIEFGSSNPISFQIEANLSLADGKSEIDWGNNSPAAIFVPVSLIYTF